MAQVTKRDPSIRKEVCVKVASDKPASLSSRADDVCSTLAACGELVEAIIGKVGAFPSEEVASPPRDESLTSAIESANYRASCLLDKLRDLAGCVGA